MEARPRVGAAGRGLRTGKLLYFAHGPTTAIRGDHDPHLGAGRPPRRLRYLNRTPCRRHGGARCYRQGGRSRSHRGAQTCEQRDRKGLYAKARAGIIKEFTGVSDPYEPPVEAEITLDTTDMSPEESAHQVLLYLEAEGYVGPRKG